MEKNLDSGKSNDNPKFQPLEWIDTDSRDDMYRAMRYDAILIPETSGVDGKPVINIYHDIRETLFSIDNFVKEIIEDEKDDPGFVFIKSKSLHFPGGVRIECSKRAKHWYRLFLMYVKLKVDANLECSEHIQLFFQVVSSMNLEKMFKMADMEPGLIILDPRYQGKLPDHPQAFITINPRREIFDNERYPGYIRAGELFNEFLRRIRAEANTKAFKDKVRHRKELSEQNFESACLLIDALAGIYSKLLVLRVEFGYRKEIARGVTLDEAHRDLKHFWNNARKNKLFRTMIGYIWKLEEGEQRGYHFHIVFILNGSAFKKDAHYAERFGEYWEKKVTKGRGTYFNCNRHPLNYKKVGIGMIKHDDQDKLMILKEQVIGYLTKTDQYLMIKGRRTFGRSEIPKKPIGKTGRPRRYARVERTPNHPENKAGDDIGT